MDPDKRILLQAIAEEFVDSTSSSSSSSQSSSSSSTSSSSSENDTTHAKVSNFLKTVCEYSDADFRGHFRLSRSTANISIEAYLSSAVCPSYKSGRKNVGAQTEVYVFLWYVAKTVTCSYLSNLFGICDSTAWAIVNRISAWLVSIGDRFIKWPRSSAKIEEITSGFQKIRGISCVIGAIDGTHIQITAPSDQTHVYCNRKKYCSIILQAVVDHKKRFIDIHCGEPGLYHDSRVLRRSPLYRKAIDEYATSFPNQTCLIGDSAYASQRWLVPPFRDTGRLTTQQKRFNHLLSATRMVVENAFGILKSRFRRLLHFTEHSNINTVISIAMACCVLHNLCINEHDTWTDIYDDEENVNPTEESNSHSNSQNNEQDRRSEMFNHMLELGLL